MNKESTIFYHEWLPLINSLSDKNKLKLYQMIFSFDKDHLPKIDDPHLKSIFDYISNKIAKNNSKYQEKCSKARESINARWNKKDKKDNTNVYERKKRIKTYYDNVNDNVNDKDKDNENENENENSKLKEKEKNIKKEQEKMLADEKKKLLERRNYLFEEFWRNYTPIKTLDGRANPRGSKQTALAAYLRAIAKHTPEIINNGLERYLKNCQANSILTCGATVFLNQKRFLGDDDEVVINAKKINKINNPNQRLQNMLESTRNILDKKDK